MIICTLHHNYEESCNVLAIINKSQVNSSILKGSKMVWNVTDINTWK